MFVTAGCLIGGLVSSLRDASAQSALRCIADGWPLWQEFTQHFIQSDGRVVDSSTPRAQSTSEGQSYALFFALVANDAATFDRVWQWTRNNLKGDAPEERLPAWQWGKADDGAWRVLDANSAADADLWLAYSLLAASDLWKRPDYERDGLALLSAVEREEVIDLPGRGPMLLPGRKGFAGVNGLWRLNPSYLPLPLLRQFSARDPRGPWTQIARNTLALVSAFPATQLTPDWIAYCVQSGSKGRFAVDPLKGDRGSYDAIRSYLWAGVTSPRDPLFKSMLAAQRGMAATVAANGASPESVQTDSGQASGTAGFGFSAALIPYLHSLGEEEKAGALRLRALNALEQARRDAAEKRKSLPYYYYALSLFGLGWDDRRYRFLPSGALQVSWMKTCSHTADSH